MTRRTTQLIQLALGSETTHWWPWVAVLAIWTTPMAATAQNTSRPGDVYREYSYHTSGDDWRVTDKEAVKRFPQRASRYLPNAKLTFQVADLANAVRAEVMLDRWGGHRGTINKRIRFNDGEWIIVPELSGIPAGIRPEMLMFQDNPVVRVPLEDLVEGANVFEGDCDEEGGFGWGQWGVYAFTVRIYYAPESKATISGRITSPSAGDTIRDDPLVQVDANAETGVARVDLVGYYEDYDFDGDGRFADWQESHFQLVRGEASRTRSHIGTRWSRPYHFRWDTNWVPDQPPATVKLVARVQDARGYWFVTDIVDKLSLERDDVSVQLYRAREVPEDFGVRANRTKSCSFDVSPASARRYAVEAGLHFRSWHGWDGHHEPLQLNGHPLTIDGKNHHFDYDLLPVAPEAVRDGRNVFTVHSNTEHHQLEVLWPGPAIVVRYGVRPE